MQARQVVRLVLIGCAGLLCGCFTVAGNEAITDRYLATSSAGAIATLQASRREQLADVQLPTEADETAAGPPEAPATLELDLPGALTIAMTRSRRFLQEREDVDLSALSLRDAQHLFEPRLASTVAFLMSDGRNLSRVTSQSGDLSVSQRLPLGGDLSLGLSHDTAQTNPETGATIRGSINRLAASLTHPLLRGAGWELTREPLTQAQRNLRYAVRSFELFRQDFAIEVVRSFYGLIETEKLIDNSDANLESFTTLYKRTQALHKIGRASKLDLLRAEQQRLSAENDLVDSRERYQSQLDQFKIQLGVPVQTELTILPEQPHVEPVDLGAEEAIAIATQYRLDLRNADEQLEDGERHLRLARNALLPDVNLSASVDVVTDLDTSLTTTDFEDRRWSLGMSVELPVDRVAERNAYRASRIRFDRQQRAHDLFIDNLHNGVRATLRSLRRAADSLAIQRKILQQEEIRYRIARRRHDMGQIENRDVVEATLSLGNARDAVVRNTVDHEIAFMELQRDLGILIVEDLLIPRAAPPPASPEEATR